MHMWSRILVGTVFVLSAMICGGFAGAWGGGHYLVGRDSGLAGAVTVLGYGILGAALGAAVAAALARWLPGRGLLLTALPVVLAGGVLAWWSVVAYSDAAEQQRVASEDGYERLPAFRVAIAHPSPAVASPFARFEIRWGTDRDATLVTAEPAPRRCVFAIGGPDAVRMLGALRAVGAVLIRAQSPCDGTPGAVEHQLEWRIDEPHSVESAGRLALTAACLDAHPGLAVPLTAALEIESRHRRARACRPLVDEPAVAPSR